MKRKAGRLRCKNIISLTAAAALALAVIILTLVPGWRYIYECSGIYPKSTGGISVSFLDAGQADCIYISAENHNILIDSGADNRAERVAQFLDRNSIRTIDVVIATHPDLDHINGMETVISDYEVKNLYIPKIKEKYIGNISGYAKLIKSAEKCGVCVRYVDKKLVKSDEFPDIFSHRLEIDFLSPECEYGDTNADSVVLKLKYGEVSFLFTGDATAEVEYNLLRNNADVEADVLKVAHHGSRSSGTESFLNAVNPAIAVVSVGDNNYNLPNIEVIRRLYRLGCEIYRTDEDGTITLTSDGRRIDVHKEK